MAQQSKSRKYVTLDDVRVSYDPKVDLIQLTSGDEELKGRGGFKVDIHNMSSEYRVLREVLKAHGLIRNEPWAKLSTEDWLRLERAMGDDEILIGANLNGEPLSWNTHSAPHLWIYSTRFSGATFVTRSILSQLLKKGWEFGVIELDSQEHLQLRDRGVLADQSSSVAALLADFRSAMESRYRSLEEQNVMSFRSSAEPMDPLVLFVEDLTPLYRWAQGGDSGLRDFARSALGDLRRLARLGRAVNIHLVLQTKVRESDPRAVADAELMGEIFEENLANFNYVAMGCLSQDVLPRMLHRKKPLELRGTLGRGTLIGYGTRDGFEAAHIPEEEYRARIGEHLRIR